MAAFGLSFKKTQTKPTPKIFHFLRSTLHISVPFCARINITACLFRSENCKNFKFIKKSTTWNGAMFFLIGNPWHTLLKTSSLIRYHCVSCLRWKPTNCSDFHLVHYHFASLNIFPCYKVEPLHDMYHSRSSCLSNCLLEWGRREGVKRLHIFPKTKVASKKNENIPITTQFLVNSDVPIQCNLILQWIVAI